jgi:hypothetical protein
MPVALDKVLAAQAPELSRAYEEGRSPTYLYLLAGVRCGWPMAPAVSGYAWLRRCACAT